MASLPKDMVFDEGTAAHIVAARFASSSDERLAQAMTAIVVHATEIIRELQPTKHELRQAVAFLTEVGHFCDERRQEWVLLFDLLGISALVEEMSCKRPKGATRNAVRGPFYRPDAPQYPLGASISLDHRGEPLNVNGKVIDLDGRPVAGATVETWQPNHEGIFENQEPDLQPDCNLRGIFRANEEGRFWYRSVKPGGYQVPGDGPVGELMKRLGYPLWRPAHLHFSISAHGFQTVTTQIFDSCDPHLAEDAILGVRPDLIGEFRKCSQAPSGPQWDLEYTFVLAREKADRAGEEIEPRETRATRPTGI